MTYVAYTSVQQHNNCFADACIELTITMNIKMTSVTDQNVYGTSSIFIDDYILEVVYEFPPLDSSNFYLKANLIKRSDKAGSNSFSPYRKRAWDYAMLITNILVACVLDTLLYGSGPCTPSKNANAAPSSCVAQEQTHSPVGKILSKNVLRQAGTFSLLSRG